MISVSLASFCTLNPSTTFAILFTCIPRVFCFFPLCLHMPQLRYITNRIFIRYNRGDLICVFLCSSPTIYYHMFCIRCFLVFISSSTTNISRSLTLLCSLLLLLFLYDNYLYRQEAFVFFCLFFF